MDRRGVKNRTVAANESFLQIIILQNLIVDRININFSLSKTILFWKCFPMPRPRFCVRPVMWRLAPLFLHQSCCCLDCLLLPATQTSGVSRLELLAGGTNIMTVTIPAPLQCVHQGHTAPVVCVRMKNHLFVQSVLALITLPALLHAFSSLLYSYYHLSILYPCSQTAVQSKLFVRTKKERRHF